MVGINVRTVALERIVIEDQGGSVAFHVSGGAPESAIKTP